MLENIFYSFIFIAIFTSFYISINQYRLDCSRKMLHKRIQYNQETEEDTNSKIELYSTIFNREKNTYTRWLKNTANLLKNRYNYYASVVSILIILCTYIYYPSAALIYIAFPFFVLINYFVLRLYYDTKRKQIVQDLPESLDYIHRSLRAGLTLQQALIVLPDNCPPSLKDIFQNTADKIKLGQEINSAIWDSTKHLNIKELNYFMLLSKIQQEVGGNFSETVNTLSGMLKAKNMLSLKLRALTAEARTSSILLGSLPFIIGILISYINPNYINVFFYDVRGNYMLAGCIVLLFLGTTIMLKLAKIDP